MKIEHRACHYTRRTSLVTLETDAERAITKADLILICDNLTGIKYNQNTQSYDLTGESFGEERHFGGRVEPIGADRYEVTVYTD